MTWGSTGQRRVRGVKEQEIVLQTDIWWSGVTTIWQAMFLQAVIVSYSKIVEVPYFEGKYDFLKHNSNN